LTRGAGRHRRRSRDRGQATVELALALPLVAVLLLVVAQVGLVVHDQVLVVHAAREGARAAAVQRDGGVAGEAERAVHAALPLDRDRLRVETASSGGLVRVTVRYRSPVDLPLIGLFLQDVDLEATAVMAAER
jgi:Flp pilus assembly protein TadG